MLKLLKEGWTLKMKGVPSDRVCLVFKNSGTFLKICIFLPDPESFRIIAFWAKVSEHLGIL